MTDAVGRSTRPAAAARGSPADLGGQSGRGRHRRGRDAVDRTKSSMLPDRLAHLVAHARELLPPGPRLRVPRLMVLGVDRDRRSRKHHRRAEVHVVQQRHRRGPGSFVDDTVGDVDGWVVGVRRDRPVGPYASPEHLDGVDRPGDPDADPIRLGHTLHGDVVGSGVVVRPVLPVRAARRPDVVEPAGHQQASPEPAEPVTRCRGQAGASQRRAPADRLVGVPGGADVEPPVGKHLEGQPPGQRDRVRTTP
jgi:hypothetical protein